MNSKVVKFVAGGGKTTLSKEIIKSNSNGLYLAFTNSVVKEINDEGYLSRTIDSPFQSFIIPKFTSLIPLIATGSKIISYESAELPDYQKGVANIWLDLDGNLYNKSKKLSINLNTSNKILHNMDSKDSIGFVKMIFRTNELRLTHEFRSNIALYLITNYSKEIINILNKRFDFIIIDEAQDLKDYREKFAKALYDSQIKLVLFGDDNQNINGGRNWFETLAANEMKIESHRCPENNCKWIRENLDVRINGNKNFSEFRIITYEDVLNYDDGKQVLLYVAYRGNDNKKIIDSWKGPKNTIKSAKGSTIDNNIVIIGSSLNKKNYYTAITRTTKNVYSTISKITKS